MTFLTGSANTLEALLSALDAFATGAPGPGVHGGWSTIYTVTNPQTTDGWFELNKGSISFSARYTPPSSETPVHMSCHHALAPDLISTAPGNHTQDSGNGYNATPGQTNAQIATERHVSEIGNGPFASYHFFADDTGPGDYINCVVQPVIGTFRHFGFGLMDKFGDNWTGGEYVYGHRQIQGGSTPITPDTQTLLDGLGTGGGGLASENKAATIRIGGAGLLNIGAAEYGVSIARVSASIGTDTDGNIRQQIHGTFRAGMEPRGFGSAIGNNSAGLVPLYSIGAWYRDPNNPRVQLLGYLPDVRALNIRNFAPGEEITDGTDTWVVFPLSIKTLASVNGATKFSGIAYKKVV